jgi:hypothetical protein
VVFSRQNRRLQYCMHLLSLKIVVVVVVVVIIIIIIIIIIQLKPLTFHVRVF